MFFNVAEFLPVYVQCRRKTGMLWTQMLVEGGEVLFEQPHPEFSPIAWHIGHIAFTETLWILQHLGGYLCLSAAQHRLFASDGLPKSERGLALTPSELEHFLWDGHDKVVHILQNLEPHEWRSQQQMWVWLFHHECQHQETIAFLWQSTRSRMITAPARGSKDRAERWIPPGMFMQGAKASMNLWVLDNEQMAFSAAVPQGFWIEAGVVGRSQYGEFMAAGGYTEPCWWSEAGWQWRCEQNIRQPQYWEVFTDPDHPVVGVSWYEATAYARFCGKSLPSETEWEWASLWLPELLGTVWQWTRSAFAAYPGFVPFPYSGYSQSYFDQAHYVLRGGSWVTHPWLQRPSFRNWYHPHVRQPFTGICCLRYDHGC
ncbi:MAG: ergothioneine biosynthesis protein EgtB [Oscillatoriales cyanobacterium SM2_2_1]|nr:ergothioneine biosynthesis protein EgtB [Oscillatoriales cyanobacterium SM2_2_1]